MLSGNTSCMRVFPQLFECSKKRLFYNDLFYDNLINTWRKSFYFFLKTLQGKEVSSLFSHHHYVNSSSVLVLFSSNCTRKMLFNNCICIDKQVFPHFQVTVKEQQEWKIPPCISNWKNAKVIITDRTKLTHSSVWLLFLFNIFF